MRARTEITILDDVIEKTDGVRWTATFEAGNFGLKSASAEERLSIHLIKKLVGFIQRAAALVTLGRRQVVRDYFRGVLS